MLKLASGISLINLCNFFSVCQHFGGPHFHALGLAQRWVRSCTPHLSSRFHSLRVAYFELDDWTIKKQFKFFCVLKSLNPEKL
jgi:hypothetical protein